MKTFNTADCSIEFLQYVQDLYSADSFQTAFQAFEQRAQRLGYESALYTYIPKVILDTGFAVEPVFKVSENYSPELLEHYVDKRLDKFDPLIRAVEAGIDHPIDWWGDVSRSFTNGESASQDVMKIVRHYGIKSGVTVPLMSGSCGIAGASFINTQSNLSQGPVNPNLEKLVMSTRLFHSMVQSNALYKGEFARTLLDTMSQTERRFLAGLARGYSPGEIAYDIGTSPRYLEQVMLRIRRKLSGVNATSGMPTINRNQLLYYAGLINIVEHDNNSKQK